MHKRLRLRLDPDRLRRWHLRLAGRLAKRPGTNVSIEWARAGEELPASVSLLFALERLIHGMPAQDMATSAQRADFAAYAADDAAPDLVIDLTGADADSDRGKKGPCVWRVTFDGTPGETALLAALVDGDTPAVAVIDAATGAQIAAGCPGTETKGILLLSFQDVLARTATLLLAALDGAAARLSEPAQPAGALSTKAVARFTARELAGAVIGRLYHLCYNAPHWRVGWRFVDGADVVDLRAHPPGGWNELPDDRRRFYADPFPIAVNGRTYLFVEEFEHRLGRGIISAVAFDSTGPVGTPRPVLETDTHLSYPFVFAHDGEMWMVPENSAAETIDLYRAAPFPHRWIKEGTLVSGVAASDATLFTDNGRWWMLATVRDDGGAYSDALHIWSAEALHGPWLPHRRNPVMVDIAATRPAGRVVRRGDKLIRPFQNCRDGYGAALGLAEITQLDDEGFSQRIEAELRPGPTWPGRRLHTLNRDGWLECIDGSAYARRFF